MRSRFLLVAALVLLAALLPQVVLAAPAAQQAPGEGNLGYLLAGFIAVWAGFFAYIFYIARKNIALRRDVEDLKHELSTRRR
jgi:CcmD family protein